MSLILDALRKSEAERKRGQAPGLHSGAGRLRERDREWLPYASAAAVLALAGGGAWWLLGKDAVEADSTSTQTAAASAVPALLAQSPDSAGAPAPSADNAPAPGLATTGSLTTAPLPERESQPVPAPEAEARLLPASMGGSASNTQSAAMSGGGEWPAPELAAPATASAQPLAGSAPAELPQPTAAPVTPPTSQVPAAVPTPVEVAAATPPPTPSADPFNQRVVGGLEATSTATLLPPSDEPAAPKPAVPTIYELDYAMRRELPNMQLSMHVYNADPQRAFALVNGKRYQAGGEAIDGKVLLVEVLPDGLLCEFNGQRFLFPRK